MNRSKQAWWRGQRGEWFVIAQFALFLLIVLGPRTVAGLPPWPAVISHFASSVGMGFLALGGLVSLIAALHLGSNLTPLPHPKEGATLVVTGMYRFVRHPIYLGVILMAAGFALAGAFLAFDGSAVPVRTVLHFGQTGGCFPRS